MNVTHILQMIYTLLTSAIFMIVMTLTKVNFDHIFKMVNTPVTIPTQVMKMTQNIATTVTTVVTQHNIYLRIRTRATKNKK